MYNADDRGPDTQLTVPRTDPVVAAARDAFLVHIYPTGTLIGRRYPLTGRPLSFGRAEDCGVRLADPSVSRKHALVEPAAGGYVVSDLGSTNGTFVNDDPVAGRHPLKDGDNVRVGNTIYRFLTGGNIEALYHEEIYRLTVQDALTRTHNRRALMEFLDREASRSRRHARPLSVALLDVDHFKALNDARGHLAGDMVLRELAARVRPQVRQEDLFARYGGEEFALALVETPHPEAVVAAERIRSLIREGRFGTGSAPVRVTVSIGVATTCGEPGLDPAALLKAADERLYAAKRGGRDRVVGEDDSAVTPSVAPAGPPTGR
jgi:diguanylate cyclase (GGDEF)-like protein